MRSALPLLVRRRQFRDENNPGKSHDLHGRSSRNQTDGFGGAWPWPDVRAPGKEAYCGAGTDTAGYRYRDDGVRRTRGSQGMGRPMNGPGWQWRSLTSAGWRRARSHLPDPSHTPSERSSGRSGQRHDNGQGAGSPGMGAGCQAGRSLASQLRGVLRGLPRCFTSWRQVAASPGSTYVGRRIGPPLSAGDAGTGRRHGTTCSRCAQSGRASRRSCGQRYRRGAGGGRAGSRSGTSCQREVQSGSTRLPLHHGCRKAGPG